jgi:PKD-like domain
LRRCEVFGDLLCDTEASSELSARFVDEINCQWNGGVNTVGIAREDDRDFLGARWRPQTNNIMSYSIDACITRFTLGQIGVILNTLENDIGYGFVRSSSPNLSSVTCPRTLCRGEVGTYIAVQSNATDYVWTFSQNNPAPEMFGTGQSGSMAIIRAPTITTGTRTITAFVTPNCCDCTTQIFGVSSPNKLTLYGPTRVNRFEEYRYNTNYIAGASYDWSIPNGWSIISNNPNDNEISVYVDDDARSGTIGVEINNLANCNMSGWKNVIVGGGPLRTQPMYGDELKVSPNPTRGLAKVEIPIELGRVRLRVHLITDYKMLQEVTTQGNTTLDLSAYPAGIYLIEVESEKETFILKTVKIN